MDEENKKVQKLSIFLIKNTVSDFKEVINENASVKAFELKPSLNLKGVIYIGLQKINTAQWRELLQEGTDQTIPDLINTSNRAVLLLEVEERIFALTFGYGQHLIKDNIIERDFGLKTTLNLVDPQKLRSIDKANMDELTVLTKTQTSRTTNTESFNLDILKDLLRNITGEPNNKELGNVISGSEGAYIVPKLEFSEIYPKLIILKKAFESTAYKKNFEWVDNLKIERDPEIISKLEVALIDSLKSKSIDKIHLAPPQQIDWTTFEGLSFTPKGDTINDFDIDFYYQYKNDDLSGLTVEKVKKDKLFIKLTGDDFPLRFFDCINYQTEIDNTIYVLTLGGWYSINKVFADNIINYIKQIKESETEFIACECNFNEGQYNEALANSDKDYILLDKKTIKCEATRSSIEPCDVLTKSGEFIHVKFKKSSSTLSHLFSQGRVSAYALRKDRNYRKELRKEIKNAKKISNDIVPLDKISTSNYIVTYAIIDKSDKELVESLPFFSLLNLRQNVEIINMMGYEVRLKKVCQLKK